MQDQFEAGYLYRANKSQMLVQVVQFGEWYGNKVEDDLGVPAIVVWPGTSDHKLYDIVRLSHRKLGRFTRVGS
jgi:hypothetical protein